MKTIRLIIVVMAFVSIAATSFAQQKYAVLITGDYAGMSYSVPLSDQWNGGQGKSTYGYNEFWNDTFLMWEMLQTKGYSQENIFVLFADGQDFHPTNYALRYTPPQGVQVTDYSASIANVTNVFNGLHNGTGGFPQVTNDDFLFVWTFDHGGGSGGNSTLYLIDGVMTDNQFAALVNPITANKKVYWMQQCRSGGFADDLEGSNVVFHSACQPNQNAFRADNSPYTENEVINGQVYNHGEFNFHVYSPTNGSSPAYNTSYGNEPYTAADLNNDNFISISESYAWEESHESRQLETPLYSDLGNIGEFTSLEYPTLLHTDVSNSINYRGLIGISKDVHVLSGKQLTFVSNADVYLLNNAKLIIDAGATLVIQDGAQIFGGYNNSIQVNGNLQIGQNVTFAIGSLYLNNNALQTTFIGTTFNGTELINYGSKLTMNNCTFNSCNYAYSFRGSVFVNNSSFTNTWLYLENQSQVASATAHILGCNFNNANTNVGIDMRNFNKYLISDNDIKAKKNGIQVNYCGSGPAGNKGIFRNSIHNCSWTGVLAYNTSGIIENNTIFNNGVGIKLMNNCNMSVIGNPDAQTLSQTQQIRDNESYEVYITQFSFPYLFQYNAIIDEDNIGNPTDPMLLYSNAGINYPQFPKWYVENNCWGSNFNYEDDLWVSYGTFKVYPTWCPSGAQPIDDDPMKEMFADAMDKINNGYYNDAKNILQYLVQNYPRSIQGQSAMKELLVVEEYLGKDFAGLKNYYRTNDSIVSDSLLKKLGDFLGNQCDIKLGNWPEAIDWFENRILNPACLEDSIFSIIDLGNVYFLMENQGLKFAYSGNLKQFIPETKSKYFEHRDFLLSLLPGENLSNKLRNDITNLSNGSLLQNVPNPFTGNTQIWYKVEKKANVTISVTDLTGKEIQKIEQGTKDKGTYKVDLKNTQMAAGTYFYSLFLNGKKSDTKKMVNMR